MHLFFSRFWNEGLLWCNVVVPIRRYQLAVRVHPCSVANGQVQAEHGWMCIFFVCAFKGSSNGKYFSKSWTCGWTLLFQNGCMPPNGCVPPSSTSNMFKTMFITFCGCFYRTTAGSVYTLGLKQKSCGFLLLGRFGGRFWSGFPMFSVVICLNSVNWIINLLEHKYASRGKFKIP